MFNRKSNDEGVTLDIASRRPARKVSDTGVYNAGETTGMFRARTADGILVELEDELDPERLPENLRKFLVRRSGH